MDINRLYAQAGSIGNNGSLKYTASIQNIPITTDTFTDAYYLGYMKHWFDWQKTTQATYNPETNEVTFNDITDYSAYPSIGYGAHIYSSAMFYISNYFYDTNLSKFVYSSGTDKYLLNNFHPQATSMRNLALDFVLLGINNNDAAPHSYTTFTSIADFLDFYNGNRSITLTDSYYGRTYTIFRSDLTNDGYYDTPDNTRFVLKQGYFDSDSYYDDNNTAYTSYRPQIFAQSNYLILNESKSSVTFGERNSVNWGTIGLYIYNGNPYMYKCLPKAQTEDGNTVITAPFIGHLAGKFNTTEWFRTDRVGQWAIIDSDGEGRTYILSERNASQYPLGFIWQATIEDVYKNASLYRWTTSNVYGYSDGVAYYPTFNQDDLNEFTLGLQTGTQAQLNLVLPDWYKLDNIQANDFVNDKPSPSDEDDDPSGAPTNDKKGKEKVTKDEVPAFFNRSYQIGNTTSFYALTASEVSALRTLLMQQSDNFYNAVQKIGASSFYEFINSFRFWPINLDVSPGVHNVTFANELLMSGDNPVQYKVLTNSSGSETICYKNTYICFWNLANLTWENNFLDYEPYTKLTLTLPYVGTFDLDLLQISAFGPLSSAFLKLYASIDFETGTLCYCLALSNPSTDTDLVPLLVKQVKIAVDIALNANNATAQSDAILNAGFNNIQKTLNLVNAGTKMVTTFQNPKAKVGNKIGATTGTISSIADSAKGVIDYANATRAIPVTIGANSGSIASTFYCQHPYLSHYHPRTANPDNYNSAVGYLWEGAATIKNLSGFSIARNPNLKNIQATEEEKNLISEILTTGFYA